MNATPLPASTRQKRFALVAITGMSIVGTLSACSSTTAAETTPTDTSAVDTSAVYTDGDYSASGSYESPGGTESIDVELTLEGDTVTDLTVTPAPVSPNGKIFQGKFISGIDALVVGKDIDTISVDKVAGSSLTSGGFMDALETIKADALSE